MKRHSDDKPRPHEVASSPSRSRLTLSQSANLTNEIIATNQEIDRIDKELLPLEDPLPMPAGLKEPLYVGTRGGWFADQEIKNELADRKELQGMYNAEKEARKKRRQQLRKRRRALSTHLKKLLSASTSQPVNAAEPINSRSASPKREEPKSTQYPTIADKLASPSQYPTMNIKEVRQSLGNVARSTLYRWMEEGKLQRAHLGREPGKRSRVLFRTGSVKEMLEDSPE